MRIPWRNRQTVTPEDVALEVQRIDQDLFLLRRTLEPQTVTVSVALIIGNKQIRIGKVSLVAGANSVVFTSNMAVPFVVLTQARDSANHNQEVEVTNQTVGGFTATVFAACTLDYMAIEL